MICILVILYHISQCYCAVFLIVDAWVGCTLLKLRACRNSVMPSLLSCSLFCALGLIHRVVWRFGGVCMVEFFQDRIRLVRNGYNSWVQFLCLASKIAEKLS